MKRLCVVVCAWMSWVILAPSAGAGSFDLEIHCTPKKIDQQNDKGSDGGANRTKEHWVYEVTVENKTFKDLTNLEVKYSTFFTQEQLGVKASPAPHHQTGTYTIQALKSHAKVAFSTDPIELNKSNLVGNWIYSSGAKPNAQDTLVGLAVRVFQNGQPFAEYANPSTLSREKWE